MIRLFSLTLDQTEQERSPEHSAVMILMALTDQTEDSHWYMYASKIMMSLYQTRLLHLRKKKSTIHLVSILQQMARHRFVLQRQRSMHMLLSSLMAV